MNGKKSSQNTGNMFLQSKTNNSQYISVIVPLYNLGSLGDYCLKKCLDSLVNQTYKDFEVLLMENGSTDDTIAVAKEYCNKDNRFKLHILNIQGISNARNEGIELAQGDYIAFIDGDDFISNDYLESLWTCFISYRNVGLSIAPCYLYYINKNKQKQIPLDYTPRVLDNESKIEIFNNGLVWGKLYSKSIIDKYNIRFDTELFGTDDNLFVSEYRLCIDNVAITDKGSYFYIQGRKGQTTYGKLQKFTQSGVLLNAKLFEIYKKHNMYEKYKSFLDYELVILFIGKDFATTTLIKMPVSYINSTIELFKERLLNITLDPIYLTEWQIKYFKRFMFFVRHNKGALFIKFMKMYRNVILSPLGIKYKGKIISHSK